MYLTERIASVTHYEDGKQHTSTFGLNIRQSKRSIKFRVLVNKDVFYTVYV